MDSSLRWNDDDERYYGHGERPERSEDRLFDQDQERPERSEDKLFD